MQGLFADGADGEPEGYARKRFPAGDFLVVTTEWMRTNDEAVGEEGNGRCNRYAKTMPMPEGCVRIGGPGSPLDLMEWENADTPEGSRYAVWAPILKQSGRGGDAEGSIH